MAKITISIADRDNGKVAIVFDPSVKEITEHVQKVGIDNVSMVYHYAKACQAICLFLSEQLDKADPNESKDKSKLWMPALENVAKIWTPN